MLERDTAGTSSLFVGSRTGPCRRVQDYWTHQVPADLSERSPPFSRLSLGRSDDGHRRDRRRAKDGDDFKDDPAGMLLSVGTGVRDANMPPCARLCALNKAAILTTLAAGTNLAHVTPSRQIFLLTDPCHASQVFSFPLFLSLSLWRQIYATLRRANSLLPHFLPNDIPCPSANARWAHPLNLCRKILCRFSLTLPVFSVAAVRPRRPRAIGAAGARQNRSRAKISRKP